MTIIKRIVRKLLTFHLNAYYTLNGWRFRDLKLHIDKKYEKSLSTQDHMYIDINDLSFRDRGAKVAVIGILPPMKSGIATFNVNVFESADFPVDFYTVGLEQKYFSLWKTRMKKRSGGNVNVLPISLLMTGHDIERYESIVWILGNSDHHSNIVSELVDFSTEYGCHESYLHLHDICLHNAIINHLQSSPPQYLEKIKKLYEVDVVSVEHTGSHGMCIESLVNNQVFGLRFFSDMGINRFIVHSAYACGLVVNEVGGTAEIHQLFHPVFEGYLNKDEISHRDLSDIKDNEKPFVVGSFGYPSYDKATDQVVRAVEILRSKGMNINLRLIGYNAQQYIEENFSNSVGKWLTAYEAPTQRRFEEELIKCGLCVQLRRRNLGESTGAIPVMLRYGIPVITNGVGALGEFGNSVILVDDFQSNTVVEKILELQHTGIEPHLTREYINTHSVDIFLQRFHKALHD